MSGMLKNAYGYNDPTAHEALSNIGREEKQDGFCVEKIARGDIFYVNKGLNNGHEQKAGRPALIVSNDLNNKYSTTVEVVFLTTKAKKPMPTHITIRGRVPSIALCEQITTVDKNRLGVFVRCCTREEMKEIDKALAVSLGLKEKEEVLFYDD